jgi:hypothetical protein
MWTFHSIYPEWALQEVPRNKVAVGVGALGLCERFYSLRDDSSSPLSIEGHLLCLLLSTWSGCSKDLW